MKNKILLLMANAICTFLLGSCETDEDDVLTGVPHAKQVDMTVIIPINPSSLEYFDYVIHYYDNRGVENRDTIQGSSNGITVEGWAAANAINNNDFYVKTFSYDNMFVTCTATVELIPKRDTVGPFSFYTPKPYIYPNVYDSPSLDSTEIINMLTNTIETISIDRMDFESFKSTFGTTFSSHCGLYESEVGYETFFY